MLAKATDTLPINCISGSVPSDHLLIEFSEVKSLFQNKQAHNMGMNLSTQSSKVFSFRYLMLQLQKAKKFSTLSLCLKRIHQCVVMLLSVCCCSAWTQLRSIFTVWGLTSSKLGPFQHLLTSVHVGTALLDALVRRVFLDAIFKVFYQSFLTWAFSPAESS